VLNLYWKSSMASKLEITEDVAMRWPDGVERTRINKSGGKISLKEL